MKKVLRYLTRAALVLGLGTVLAFPAGVLVLGGSSARAAIDISRRSDLLGLKYGVFVHYVPGLTEDANGVVVSDVDTLADDFDAVQFADDLESFDVQYVKFTAWHANMIPLYPSAVQTAWRGPGTSATRDMIRDIIDAVKAKGISVILYTHPRVGHSFSNADMTATGWGSGSTYLNPNPDPGTFDYSTWNNFVQESYAELLARYGGDIDGLYIDEGDGNGQSQNVVDYPALRTMTDAFPNITTLHNYFGNLYSAHIADQERAGPIGFPSGSAATWPAKTDLVMSPLITPTWWTTEPASVPNVSPFTSVDLFRYTVLQASANRVGGGVSWSAGVYPGGNAA